MGNQETRIVNAVIQGAEFSYNAKTDYEKDGHIYCKTCNCQIDGTPVEFSGRKRIFRKPCQCDEERKRMQEERERQDKISEIKKRCFIERNQENYTFGNADESTDKELLKKVKKYVEQFEKMKEENVGLIIYGGVGTGDNAIMMTVQ